MAMASSSIVKSFDVIKNISSDQIPSFINTLSNTFFYKELKNDSARLRNRYASTSIVRTLRSYAWDHMYGARTPGRKSKISITYVNSKC